MGIRIKARYENEMLKPLEKLELEEGEEVEIEVKKTFIEEFYGKTRIEKEIADELNLPVIFHERDTKGRFLELLTTHHKTGRTGVVHCFSGNQSELEQYLKLGFCIGITGILTIKKRGADLRKLVPYIPEDRILVETDAPYLIPAPEKNRFKRNEPAFVRSVLLKLAEVRKEVPEYLSTVVWENTCRLFKINQKD